MRKPRPRPKSRPRSAPAPDCRSCRYFVDDPEALEARLPGLTILSSAYGSVRGHAGICLQLERFMEPVPAASCARYRPRGDTGSGRADQIADQ